MGKFNELLAKLMLGNEQSQQSAAGGVAEFGGFLNEQDEIRVYIDNTPNFGHQANSIHVLKRLIDKYSYAGAVTIVWAAGDENPDGVNNTAAKLALLLTNLDPRQIADAVISYGSCPNISFVKLTNPGDRLDNRVRFGITGGADNLAVNLANSLNVDAFLRLQPYNWTTAGGEFMPSRIEFHLDADRQTIDLGAEDETINLLPFLYDAAQVATVAPETWAWYSNQDYNPSLAESTRLAQAVEEGITARGASLWPVYGLHQFYSYELLLNIATTGGQYQKAAGFNSPPLVVCLLNTRSQLINTEGSAFELVLPYKQQDLKAFETAILNTYGPPTNKSKPNYQRFFEQIDGLMASNQPASQLIIIEDTISPDDLKEQILNLNNGQILIVIIGNIPRDIYNLFYSNGFPGLFEGQGTSSLPISTGMPYLQLSKALASANNYPAIPPVRQPNGAWPLACNSVVISFRRIFTNYLLIPQAQNYGEMVDLVSHFLTGCRPAQDYRSYFTSLGTFYGRELNDKLTLGLLAYNAEVVSVDAPVLLRQSALHQLNAPVGGEAHITARQPRRRSSASGGGQKLAAGGSAKLTLDDIYTALTSSWTDGFVNVVAALLGSEFADYWKEVTPSFLIEVAKDDITKVLNDESEVISVLLTNGKTNAFTVPFAISLTFTAPNSGPIRSKVECRSDEIWQLDGVPWISFAKPGFDMEVTEALTLVSGGMVGTIPTAANLVMEIRYPVEQNRWVITGGFEKDFPTIGDFFAMAGGINLVQSLPAPLNALAGFGVKKSQIILDASAPAITYSQFIFSTNSPWMLLNNPPVSLQPTITYSITNPGDLENRSWTIAADGTFKIGDGTVTINTTYPDFTAQGSLSDGVILISDLAQMFDARLDTTAAVTDFAFQVKPSTGNFMLSAKAVLDAPITIGLVKLFTLDTLGFGSSGGDGHWTVRLDGTTTILPDLPNVAIALSLSAGYDSAKGWDFAGKQTGGAIPVGDLLQSYLGWNTGNDYGIAGLSLTFATGTGSWSFGGQTAQPWSVPFIPQITVAGKFVAGFNAPSDKAVPATTGEAKAGEFGRIELEWMWQNIDITVWYDYQPDVSTYGITWGVLEGTVTGPDAKTGDYTATLKFRETVTVGSLIETMIGWLTGSKYGLEAPWDVLNSIPLKNVALVYVFNTKDSSRNKVTLDVAIGPIDLGFARIDSINVGYQSTGPDKGVQVTLNGSFIWNVGSDAVGDDKALGPWDASQPGAAPAPKGWGSKYLDLRLLALGQHVTYPGLTSVTTVQEAIALMADLPDPTPGQLPPVRFAADSDWLIGTDFGLLRNDPPASQDKPATYFITLQVVFNDPNLYALRLALDGELAKVFKGLDFQIMYRQVSDTVGVYSARIALPTIMRRLSVGLYTITLPEFGIDIYTNGDFKIDIGFPWNADFSRSFTIEAIIAPGIPLLGSGGFYFGKLSSASSTDLPVVTNGTFNPALIFGFGLQAGFGKSVEIGILSAGFSLTMVGILEGIIATWNPYKGQNAVQTSSQLQDNYYFKLSGTVGVIGKLYGSVDFGIIKANVNVEIKILVQLTYESFVSLTITVSALVEASASVKIDLGLFSIKLSFSFSLRVQESFTLPMSGTSPWLVANSNSKSANGLLAQPAAMRTSALRSRRTMLMASTASTPSWGNLTPAANKAPLSGYAAMGLTGAADEWTDQADQLPCWISMLFINSVAGDQAAPPANAPITDTAFEILSKMVTRWVVAASQPAPLSAAEVDALRISDVELDQLLDGLLASTDTNPMPIPLSAIDSFFDTQFVMNVSLPPERADSADATYFPLPGSLTLSYPDQNGTDGRQTYSFAGYNSIDDAGLAALRAYFDALAIQVEQEQSGPRLRSAALGSTSLSMSEWIRGDYMLLIARQMVQALKDGLRNYHVPITPGLTPHDIVTGANTAAGLSGAEQITVADLFTANQSHPLAAARTLTIAASLMVGTNQFSFNALGESEAADGVTGAMLAAANASTTGILTAGITIRYPGNSQPDYLVTGKDSLADVAAHFRADLADLLSDSTVLETAGLPAPGSTLVWPVITCQSESGDSLTSIAGRDLYKGTVSASALATVNAGRTILRNGAVVRCPDRPDVTVGPRDALVDIANRMGLSLTDLLASGSVLTQTDLLQTPVNLLLPDFTISTSDATPDLSTLAQQFAITPALLGAVAQNGQIIDLFASTDANNADASSLNLPHLPRYQVGDLIGEAQRSGAIRNLSGMASRYYLHGLRLPTDHITPLMRGMWVRDQNGQLSLPPMAGLFALTGQQIPLPSSFDTTPYEVSLDRSAGPGWLQFKDANGAATDRLTISVRAGSNDANRITSLAASIRSRLDVALLASGAGAMGKSSLTSYPLSTTTGWLSAGAISLPNGVAGSGQPDLRIWTLPDSLTRLPDLSVRRVDPCFAVLLSRYDEATGSTVNSPVGSYGWASTISLTVRKVPASPDSPATATSYELASTSDQGILILERLLDQRGNRADAIHSLTLSFGQDGGSGLQSDATVTMGISQANLSTDTRPGGGLMSRAMVEGDPGSLGLLNSSAMEFLRLVWEAGITRSGGFYLYYFDSAEGRGLPEAIFNDKGEAELTILVVYADTAGTDQTDRLASFMNAVITRDGFDTTSSSVIALSNPPRLPMPTVLATADDSIASLSYGDFGNPGELALANAGLPLTSSTRLRVSHGLFMPPPGPGLALSAVAARFGTTVQDLTAANGGTLPDPLAYPDAIHLPDLTLTVGQSASSNSLTDIADWYGVSVPGLAAQNLSVPGLWSGQPVALPGGPTDLTPSGAAGSITLEMLRTVPPDVPAQPLNGSDTTWGTSYLLHDLSLLGYQIAQNRDFYQSDTGLPAGPTTPPDDNADQSQPRSKSQSPRLLKAGDPDWRYQQDVPFSRYARNRVGDSPYNGIGDILQISYQWQDLYGNRLATNLSNPQAGDVGPYNQSPLLMGYMDALLGIGQWPSVASSWHVTGDTSSAALAITLSFDNTSFGGLLQAYATTQTSILAKFTAALDPVSAADPRNYSLSDDIGLGPYTIQSANLQPDGQSVALTITPPLPQDGLFTLTINGVNSLGGTGQSGQASFLWPDDPAQRHSSVQTNAAQAALSYASLYNQLSDPNGISWTAACSLLVDQFGTPLALPLPADSIAAITLWLFGKSAGDYPSTTEGILAFLQDRASFGINVAAPAVELAVKLPVSPDSVSPAPITDLTTSLTIARTGGAVAPELESAPGIRRAVTTIPPLMQGLSGPLALTEFALGVEKAFSVSGSHRLRVATGVDRAGAVGSGNNPIWAVRVGDTLTQPLSYRMTTASNDPLIFAPRPVSNRLESRNGIAIRSYETGRGLSSSSQPTSFTNIDLDSWVGQLFSTIDGVLTPDFLPAIQILDKIEGSSRLARLLSDKEDLAGITANLMVPIYADQQAAIGSTSLTSAREAYRQDMLSVLSNAFNVKAALGFTADVNGGIAPDGTVAPRLYGNAITNPQMAAASLIGDDGLTIIVSFTASMAEGAAGDIASYTLTPAVQITRVVLSADGRTATLTLADPAEAGTSSLTVSDRLTDQQGWPIAPPLMGTVSRNPPSTLNSTITLSSPKLSLQTGSGQPLTVMVTGPALVRDDQNSIVSSVDLNLRYAATAIEHQIDTLPGITGYQASSWLSFVIADPTGPLTADLGAFAVPMPMRGFPTSPTVPDQSAVDACPVNADKLSDSLLWTMTATYSLPLHYPQDRVYGTIRFNTRSGTMLLKSLRDAFAALAQFTSVQASVQQDLDQWLAGIDATIDPASSEGRTRLTNASVALDTLLEMTGAVVEAAGPDGTLALPVRSSSVGDLDYSFFVTESSIDWGDTNDALLVSLNGAPPEGVGTPAVLINPEQYEAVRLPTSSMDVGLFVYRDRSNGGYLTAELGQTITDRFIQLPDMNILKRQDARTTVHLTRNEELVPNRPSAPDFVYTTPEVSCANPLYPSISRDQTIDIARINTNGTPAIRSLKDHLTTLFDALLAENTQPTLSVQVQTTYSYGLTSYADIDLPLFLQTPLVIETSGDGTDSLTSMIDNWTDAITLWFDKNNPSQNRGRLLFDLWLMSDLTDQSLPLVRLSDLELQIHYIQPGLGTL